MLLAVVCAVVSALFYAVASVLQQRAAAQAPPEKSLKLTLLTRLAHNRMWVAGIAADVVAYALQFTALDHGSLVVVQPLLVCGLLFALPLGAGMSGARLTALDWSAAAAVCLGLALFLVEAGNAPSRGHPDAAGWAVTVLAVAASAGAVLLAGRGRPANQRAALMSVSAGIIYGLGAAFTKATANNLSQGVVHVLASWETWMLVLVGICGLLVAQSAFQAGALAASLPPMTVMDPVVSVVIGTVAFKEALPSAAAATVLEVVGLVVMSAGVFVLARAKAVQAVHGSGG